MPVEDFSIRRTDIHFKTTAFMFYATHGGNCNGDINRSVCTGFGMSTWMIAETTNESRWLEKEKQDSQKESTRL